MEYYEELWYLRHPNKWTDINRLASQYLRMFLDKLTSTFTYKFDEDGIYKEFDAYAYETIAHLEGKVLSVNIPGRGVMAIPNSYQYGVSPYSSTSMYMRFKESGFANADLPSMRDLTDLNSVLMYNTPSSFRPVEILAKLADTLAHIDTSLKIACINSRMTGVFSVENNQQKASAEEFYKALERGEYAVITGSTIMQKLEYLPTADVKSSVMSELIESRNNTLRYALRFCSLKISKDKSEAVLSNESEDESSFLDANVDVLFRQRKRACEEMTELFGEKIEVEINEIYRKKGNERKAVELDKEKTVEIEREGDIND